VRARAGFVEGSIKVLEKFCGQNLTTKYAHKNANKRLNTSLKKGQQQCTQLISAHHINYRIPIITITNHHSTHYQPWHGDPKHYTPVT
jgi:uncharacterized protein YgiM (DUF1202 family)